MSEEPQIKHKQTLPEGHSPDEARQLIHDVSPVPASSNPDDDMSTIFAHVALEPILQAANTIQGYSIAMDGSPLDIERLVEELTKQVRAVSTGDMGRAEAMLISQAHSLDAIFGNLARRSAQNMGVHLDASERYLRLALKAQNQCRSTLETLSALKNPPVVFAKQANINQGNGSQQVNNGTHPPDSRTEKIINQENELLEETHGKWLDTGKTPTTIRIDKKLEAVGKIDRSKNSSR